MLGTGLLVSASVLAVVQWAEGMTEAPALLALAVVAGAGGLLAVLCTRR